MENDDIEEVNNQITITLLLMIIITAIIINHDDQVNERMLDKAVEGQLGSAAKYGEHQDAAVLFCKFTTNQNN